jgi:acyl-CoA synthetase (AMP-forming)/AMP-acid ligase II
MKGLDAIPSSFQTLNQALAAAAAHDSGVTFVDAREHDSFHPWPVLLSRAKKVAGALRKRGISPGDRVAIVLPTSPGFCDAFFGALFAGAVPVPLYPPVRLGRLDEYHRATARMLSAAGARIVVTETRVGLLLGKAVAAARPELGMCTAAELLGADTSPFAVEVKPDDLALIQFSSGSTTDPKPVALTHRALLAQTAVLKSSMPEASTTRPVGVSWLPLYHDMGLIGCLLVAAYWPGHLVLIPPEVFLARPAIWLRTISRFRASISPAPNFAFGLCLKRVRDEDLEGVDLSSWTYAPSGAEPISIPLMERFAERFATSGFRSSALMPAYGLAEAALAVTFARREGSLRSAQVDAAWLARTGQVRDGTRAVASVGRPIPGFEIELRSERGLPVESAEVGRIFVRGPSLMDGYFGSPESTSKALVDGWLDTGDLGFERDGELYVTGRAKDVIIIRGANHVPQEFEECLDGMPGVRAGCVAAAGFLPSDGSGEELILMAEKTEGAPEDLIERIRSAVTERTGIRPHTIELLAPGTLPRTSSGKLRRSEALRLHLAGELRPPRKVRTMGLVLEIARSVAAQSGILPP